MSYNAHGSGTIVLRLTTGNMRWQLRDALSDRYDRLCTAEMEYNSPMLHCHIQEVYNKRIKQMKLYDDPFWWVQNALKGVGFCEVDRDTDEVADGIVSIQVSYDTNYMEDEISELLGVLAPFTTEGSISFVGEDGTNWRLQFTGGEWVQQNAVLQFANQKAYPPFHKTRMAMEALMIEIRRQTIYCDERYEKRTRKLLEAFDEQDPDGVLRALTGRSLFEHGVAAGIWSDADKEDT